MSLKILFGLSSSNRVHRIKSLWITFLISDHQGIRTPSFHILSVAPLPIGLHGLGAGGEGRTRVDWVEASCLTVRPHPLNDIFLIGSCADIGRALRNRTSNFCLISGTRVRRPSCNPSDFL